MPWPVPALLAWALAWAVFFGLRAWGLPMLLSLPLATLAGLLCALPAASRWRQVFIAGGFPLSAMLLVGPAGLPAATWLLPLGLLLLLYPLGAWRDAPLFPTPPGALAGLALALCRRGLAAGARECQHHAGPRPFAAGIGQNRLGVDSQPQIHHPQQQRQQKRQHKSELHRSRATLTLRPSGQTHTSVKPEHADLSKNSVPRL